MSVYVVVQSTLEQSGWLDVFKFQISDFILNCQVFDGVQ